jgi:geranylgeranyl pyrophosphate synthase
MSALVDAISKGSASSRPWSIHEHPHAVFEADNNPDRAKRVLHWITEFVGTVAVSPPQRALLETALVGLDRWIRGAAAGGGYVPSIELPLAVYTAITGEEDGAEPLAAGCTLVCLTAKLFDDLADGDQQTHWAGRSGAEINLAAATILCALPPLILAQLDIAPLRRLRMQQILAEGELRISAGQQADLALTGTREATVAEVEAAVTGKTGERFATYCALAAAMAGATPEVAALYAQFGREIGIARQLISDCHELLFDPVCRDLVHGTRTMAIVAHIDQLTGADRSRFLDLLDRARTGTGAQQTAQEEMRASTAISRVIFRGRLHYGRARALIDRLAVGEPLRSRLLHLAGPGSGDA